jgi:hypothetical protein
MTSWVGECLAAIGAFWFSYGLYCALLERRVAYVDHTELSAGRALVTINRQRLLPPWRNQIESWLVYPDGKAARRESDGLTLEAEQRRSGARGYHEWSPELLQRIHAVLTVARARKEETEKLSRVEQRAN